MIEIIQMSTVMIGYCCILLVPGGTYSSAFAGAKRNPAFCFENISKSQNDGVAYSDRADGTRVFKIGPNIADCRKPEQKVPCSKDNKACIPVS